MMKPICNQCWATYRAVSDGVLLCVVCGDPLSQPALVLSGSSETTGLVGQQASVVGRETAIATVTTNQALVAEPWSVVAGEVNRLPIDQRKSPGLAALLSFLLVGMGQIYLGQVEKGLCLLAVVLLLVLSTAMSPLGVIILFLNVLDAFLLARRVGRGQQVKRWQFF